MQATLSLILTVGLWAPTQAIEADKDDVVLRWNEIALQAIRAERTPPPIAARNLAIMHLAVFDAVNALSRTHHAYLVDVEPRAGTSPEATAVAAAHRCLASLFPRQKEFLEAELKRNWTELPAGSSREQGWELGQFVADRILDQRRNDNSASAAGRYAFKQGAGLWEPTAPQYSQALLPDWGYVTPFAIRKGTQHRPAGPPALNSEAYRRAYDEVKALGGKNSTTRTPEQTDIAIFWADDVGTVTPPGHWNRIAQTLSKQRGNSLVENARLFALLNLSLADAGILCWVFKFTYEFWRPVTAIRRADGDPAPEPDWLPLLNTPPFPAYTSGHSTFSAAAAAVLAEFYGNDKIRFATTSEGLPGATRSFDSIWAAAEEAGMSRIFGGIHWQFDNQDGLAVGRTLGRYVVANHLQPRPRQVLRPPTPSTPPKISVERDSMP